MKHLTREQQRRTQRRRANAAAAAVILGALLAGFLAGYTTAGGWSADATDKPEGQGPMKAEVVQYIAPDEPEAPAEPDESEPVYLGEFTITHYCPCSKCCGEWADGVTATGAVATEGRTIAVDPSVIPYGSEVTVYYEDGAIGRYIAEDCGGAIKGNRLDVYMDSHQAALEAGVKTASVYVKEEMGA